MDTDQQGGEIIFKNDNKLDPDYLTAAVGDLKQGGWAAISQQKEHRRTD